MTKYVSILGSTGSIGTQTLDIIDKNPMLKVVALTAGKNIKLMEEQIRKYKPVFASMETEQLASELKLRLRDMDVEIGYGMDGLIHAATIEPCDIVVTAIVGMVGIRPTIAAINAKKDIALANKETLVTAGHIIMPLAKEKNVDILPVDSEHSAIFQCLNGEKQAQVEKLLITASGGPFRGKTVEQLKNVTVEDALKHPNWAMGRKITIDSATLVNKGLEVMEAKWLFDMDLEDIIVVVHPQSVIHSMVQFVDGGIMAQLGTPDMRLPISYALLYPDRVCFDSKRLDLFELQKMTFEKPDTLNFRGLALAFEASKRGGNIPTIFNAANEKAVDMFLNRKISFLEIPQIIESAMNNVAFIANPNLKDILDTEQAVYEYIGR